MSDEIINKTIETLSKLVKKPPLNKKLLSKPPFRYLHDLFSEVVRGSSAFQGLYSDEEMNSENYKDKDSKILYLAKMIEVLKLATGSNLKANPLKIVAGLDADDTNIMLQALGKVVLKKIDTSRAIAAILNPGGNDNETPASSVAPSPAPVLQPAPQIEREETVNNISTPSSAANAEASPEPLPPTHQPMAAMEHEDEPRHPPPSSKQAKQDVHHSGRQTPEKSSRQTASKTGSARSRQDDHTEKEQQPQEPAPSMAPQANMRSRPMSARPPPPKIKTAIGADEEPASYVPVHIDRKGDDDDEFVVKTVEDAPKQTDKADLLDGQHGGLVNKILQTKRDLEGKDAATAADKNKPAVANVNTGIKDLVSLRNSIQLLCQSTNPLGKTMDYLQEDADAMNTELAVWKKENAKYEQQAKEQQKLTKEAIQPLEDRLAAIEKSIQEQLHKISILKGEILTNDAATEKVLKNIASAS